MEMKALKRKWH